MHAISLACKYSLNVTALVMLLACSGAELDAVESGKEEAMGNFRKLSAGQLKERLTSLQFQVTQKEATEPAFQNEYWDHKEPGIYVDVVSGEPLFSSLDKFDSGTGWPSFTRPLEPGHIVEREDRRLFMRRIEVRSKHADSHLGHVFDDGPPPTGRRYCMNSAALRFIPADQLATEGFAQYLSLFSKEAPGQKSASPAALETATLAGGCFWGVEELFRQLPGVRETAVGYTGGRTPNPTYDTVRTGKTGHAEAIRVVFDPQQVSYAQVLDYFFRLHDPTTRNRQGNDVGSQYRSAVFFHDERQRETAEQVKQQQSGKWKSPLVTEIVPATPFYPAEEYHQDYLQKNPGGYTCHFLRD